MVIFMKKIKYGLFSVFHLPNVLLNIFLLQIVKFMPKNLAIQYNNNREMDGIGAQLQRIFAIFSIAKNLNLEYCKSIIQDITTHPLDPFQSYADRKKYVAKLNDFLNFINCEDEILPIDIENIRIIEVDSLSPYKLFKYAFLSNFTNGSVRLVTLNVYSIIDLRPNFYKTVQSYFLKHGKYAVNKNIIIHYRRGVGNYALYGQQSIPRELPLSYYKKLWLYLQESGICSDTSKIIVFTDSPLNKTFYRPPTDQMSIWVGTPGYSEGIMTIEAIDFNEIFKGYPGEIEIYAGGDPLDSLLVMTGAQHLFLSRSSFSYIAGILNPNGIVYCAPKFWHSKMPSWKIVK